MIIEIDKIKQGIEGEYLIKKFLISENHETTQVDLISYAPDGKFYLIEIKNQERFKGPPFDGHGLHPKQFEKKLWFAKKLNVRPLLIIIEPNEDIFGLKNMFYQDMEILNNLPNSEKFTTKTGQRIIYHISAFEHKFI